MKPSPLQVAFLIYPTLLLLGACSGGGKGESTAVKEPAIKSPTLTPEYHGQEQQAAVTRSNAFLFLNAIFGAVDAVTNFGTSPAPHHYAHHLLRFQSPDAGDDEGTLNVTLAPSTPVTPEPRGKW